MKVKSVLLYGGYFLFSCVLFGVLLFPGKQAATYLSRKLEDVLPVRQVRLTGVDLAFPLALRLEGAAFELDDGRMLTPSAVKLSFRPDSLFRTMKRVRFSARFGGGLIDGTLESQQILDRPFSRLHINIRNLEMKNILYANGLADISLSFTADGRFNFPVPGGDGDMQPAGGKGQIVFSKVTARVDHPVFRKMGIFKLDFAQVDTEFSLDDRALVIGKLLAKGPVMTVNLTGDIKPEDRFSNSEFDNSFVQLEGYLQPSAAYMSKFANVPSLVMLFKNVNQKGIPIRINGRVNLPGVVL